MHVLPQVKLEPKLFEEWNSRSAMKMQIFEIEHVSRVLVKEQSN